MGIPAGAVHMALGVLSGALLAILSPGPATPQSLPPGVVQLPTRVSDSQYDLDAETRLFDLLNRIRQESGLRPLVAGGSLTFAARAHSRDMAVRGYFGHDSLEGQPFVDRLVGIVRGGTFVGENVAIAGTAEEAHAAFVASPAHLRNMLNPAFHQVGIGVATAGELGLAITEDFSE
jgi:uncharacterized protein YkwD